MQTAPGPDGINPTRIIIAVPAAAVIDPDGVADPLLTVGVEAIGDGLIRHDAEGVFGLHLVDELEGVVGDGGEGPHDGSVLDGPIGADEGEEVRVGGDGETQVGFGGLVLPFGGEGDIVGADDGKRGR